MFDSHSRNAGGQTEDCGYAILLSFSDIGNFIECLCATYLAIMVIRCDIICCTSDVPKDKTMQILLQQVSVHDFL